MRNTKKIALCGVFGALSIVVMLMGSIIPMATYACPAIAAFLIIPVVKEYGTRTGLTLYTAISLLSLILIAEKEFVMMYICVFGIYSVFKPKADKIKPQFIQYTLKALFGALSTAVAYAVLLLVFPNPLLTEEFGEMWLVVTFLVLFTVVFVLYDIAASIALVLYKQRIEPKVFGKK